VGQTATERLAQWIEVCRRMVDTQFNVDGTFTALRNHCPD
jgi:hypothetical protein